MKTQSPTFHDTDRKPVRRSLGCHVDGAALPVPDLYYAPDQVAGTIKRVAAKMPPINGRKLRKFRRFVKRWCVKNLTEHIFRHDETFDFYEWIENAPYTRKRKDDLIKVYELGRFNQPDMKVKAHVKNEPYPEPKHVRGIYSRSDDYKVRVGPFFKKLGDIIFKLKWFIKKIAVNDRPHAMKNKFGDDPNLFCTDFSQYEATFVDKLMRVETIIYRFLLQNHPMKKIIMDLIVKGMMSMNIIQYRKWTLKLMCKRMSGEMSTSVSNGIMNLLLTHFLLEEAGNKHYDSYVEGDDSINSYDVRPPTPQEYEEMGAKIKIEYPNSLSVASFCGQVFDPEDLDNVANPMEALVSFGWTESQYLFSNELTLRTLLKSKSLSLLYQYSGCPILRSLALYGLRITNDIPIEKVVNLMDKNLRTRNTYEKEQWLETLDNYKNNGIFDNTVKLRTRKLVSDLYGIPIDFQEQVEEYLDTKDTLTPIKVSGLLNYCHTSWLDYYNSYGSGNFEYRKMADIAEPMVSTGYKCKIFINPQWSQYI
jgi:hypothetical protein